MFKCINSKVKFGAVKCCYCHFFQNILGHFICAVKWYCSMKTFQLINLTTSFTALQSSLFHYLVSKYNLYTWRNDLIMRSCVIFTPTLQSNLWYKRIGIWMDLEWSEHGNSSLWCRLYGNRLYLSCCVTVFLLYTTLHKNT